jgi:hypothetical protein
MRNGWDHVFGLLAQMVRAVDSKSKGCGFESRTVRQINTVLVMQRPSAGCNSGMSLQ